MGAIARIVGFRAEALRNKYLKELAASGLFGPHTIEVNGEVEIWDIQKSGSVNKTTEATSIELPTHLASHHKDLLTNLTAGEENVFATAVEVNKTLGAAGGNVF